MKDRIKRVISKTGKPVFQFDLQGNFIKKYSNLREAADKTKISISNISQCCNGKYKQAKGYVWKFKSEVMPFL